MLINLSLKFSFFDSWFIFLPFFFSVSFVGLFSPVSCVVCFSEFCLIFLLLFYSIFPEWHYPHCISWQLSNLYLNPHHFWTPCLVFNSLWYYLMASNYFSLYVSPQKAKENKINAHTHQLAPQTTTSPSPDLLIHNLFSLPPHAMIAPFLMQVLNFLNL